MFKSIAGSYDSANRVISGGMDILWRRRLAKLVKQQAPNDVLDLATGSGDVAMAIARVLPSSVNILGLDFCEAMLVEARKKSKLGNIEFRFGDAMALPLDDASVDVVTISFGFRNFEDRARGLGECLRVLRPGGKLFVLEATQPRGPIKYGYYFYLEKILPLLGGLISGKRSAYKYFADSVRAFPGAPEFAKMMHSAGFASVEFEKYCLGTVALHTATKAS